LNGLSWTLQIWHRARNPRWEHGGIIKIDKNQNPRWPLAAILDFRLEAISFERLIWTFSLEQRWIFSMSGETATISLHKFWKN